MPIKQTLYSAIMFKGTMCRYGSRAIMHYFTGSEIITKLKVYVVLQYLCKEDRDGADNTRGQAGRSQKYAE